MSGNLYHTTLCVPDTDLHSHLLEILISRKKAIYSLKGSRSTDSYSHVTCSVCFCRCAFKFRSGGQSSLSWFIVVYVSFYPVQQSALADLTRLQESKKLCTSADNVFITWEAREYSRTDWENCVMCSKKGMISVKKATCFFFSKVTCSSSSCVIALVSKAREQGI
jgi:hypothetical protein